MVGFLYVFPAMHKYVKRRKSSHTIDLSSVSVATSRLAKEGRHARRRGVKCKERPRLSSVRLERVASWSGSMIDASLHRVSDLRETGKLDGVLRLIRIMPWIERLVSNDRLLKLSPVTLPCVKRSISVLSLVNLLRLASLIRAEIEWRLSKLVSVCKASSLKPVILTWRLFNQVSPPMHLGVTWTQLAITNV